MKPGEETRRQTGACPLVARLPRGPVYIVHLLSCVILQFLSCSFLNLMSTGIFLCIAAASDGDRIGNGNDT